MIKILLIGLAVVQLVHLLYEPGTIIQSPTAEITLEERTSVNLEEIVESQHILNAEE